MLQYRRYSKWELAPDFFSRSHFLRVLYKLDLSTSPGIPYLHVASSTGIYLGFNGFTFTETERVNALYESVRNWFSNSGARNPIRIFIKDEPHKLSKIANGKLRLISSTPLELEVIEHMLFDEQNEAETGHWATGPFKVGITLSGGGWKLIETRGMFLCADKSSWDWSVPGWAMMLDLKYRRHCCLTKGTAFEDWKSKSLKYYSYMYGGGCLFQLSSGHKFRQLVSGIIKSGSVITLSSNTHLQLWYHHLALHRMGEMGNPRMSAMGDDTVVELGSRDRRFVERYVAATESLGCKIKEYEVMCNRVEFIGFKFARNELTPLYQTKHLFRILSQVNKGILVDSLQMYRRTYCKSPVRLYQLYDLLLTLIEPSKAASREELCHWLDGTAPA